jgi:hypothetical protein
MRNFILGILVGSALTTSLGLADSDPLGLGRSKQQQKYDYYREYGQRLDIEQMRKQQDRERFDRTSGRKQPC